MRRFDRRLVNGQWIRLQLEDATQVLDLPPASKYTVSAEEAVHALASVCTAPMVATRNLYLQSVFAWLTGNGDLHAKNISVLTAADGTTSVAPIYDIAVHRAVPGPFTGVHWRGARRRHGTDFADSIGLAPRAAASANALASKVAGTMNLGDLPFDGSVRNGAGRELRFRRSELAV